MKLKHPRDPPKTETQRKQDTETTFLELYISLKDHQMRLVCRSQRELCGKVSLQHRGGGDGLQKGIVNLLLVGLALVANNGSLGGISHEEFLLSFLLLIFGSREVFIVNRSDINTLKGNLCRSGNHIRLVHTTERDTIDFVGTRHEKKPRFKGLQANNTLSTESASKENEDGSR
jgi:hypothetical protein